MFRFASIQAYHQELSKGLCTTTQALTHYLQQIQHKQGLNAFIEVFEKEALERASNLDAIFQKSGLSGKLHGIVIGIKDNICYKDHKVSAGSKMLEDFHSLYHATVIEKLLQEGAIIIGRQNCDEFAMGNSNENSFYGPVKNVLDESKVSGGSSGGSAVAVQAGLCMVSIGSDTGGSVRQPADFCGITGFKPAYGSISRYGLIAYASSFDQIGILANNVADIQIVFESIAGRDLLDSTVKEFNFYSEPSLLTGEKNLYKIAYLPETLYHTSLDPVIRQKIEDTIQELIQAGNKVEPVSFPLLDFIVPAYYILTTAEASSNLSRYDGLRFGYSSSKQVDLKDFYAICRSDGFGWEVKKRIMLGTFVLSTGYVDAYFKKAQQVRRLVKEQAEKIFKTYDFIILPTVPQTPWEIGQVASDPITGYLSDIYTVFANLAGIPAISLPLYKHENGMVFGIQAMSSQKDNLPLLRFSDYLLKNYRK